MWSVCPCPSSVCILEFGKIYGIFCILSNVRSRMNYSCSLFNEVSEAAQFFGFPNRKLHVMQYSVL